jgi:hypothetical protein
MAVAALEKVIVVAKKELHILQGFDARRMAKSLAELTLERRTQICSRIRVVGVSAPLAAIAR